MFYRSTSYPFVFLALVLTSTALYIFPPGYPQPGHVLALLLVIPLVFGLRTVILGLPEKLLLGFWVYVVGINLTYWVMHRDMTFIVSTVYWTYGLVLFFAMRQLFTQQPRLALGLPWALLIVSVACLATYAFGGNDFFFGGRLMGTFNDPNQMSYWLLCVFVACLLVHQKPAWFKPKIAVAMFVLIGLLIVLSSSRSAMLAAMVLLAAMVWWCLEIRHAKGVAYEEMPSTIACDTSTSDHGKHHRLSFIKVIAVFGGLLVVLSLLLLVLYQINGGFAEILDDLFRRSQKVGILWQLQARGYMRLIEFPEYLLFGAGQGLDGRFMEPISGHVIYEVHSSIISPLFYYGVIGFGLLYTSFYLMARDRLEGWQWLVFAAPFVYGLFTYGLRTPVFWIMLASLYTIPLRSERVTAKFRAAV